MTDRIINLAELCLYFIVLCSLFATSNIFSKKFKILILFLKILLIFGCVYKVLKHFADYNIGWEEGVVFLLIFSVTVIYALKRGTVRAERSV